MERFERLEQGYLGDFTVNMVIFKEQGYLGRLFYQGYLIRVIFKVIFKDTSRLSSKNKAILEGYLIKVILSRLSSRLSSKQGYFIKVIFKEQGYLDFKEQGYLGDFTV